LARVDLINGHSAKAQMKAGDHTLGSGRGARRRRAARRNLVERAALHVPDERGPRAGSRMPHRSDKSSTAATVFPAGSPIMCGCSRLGGPTHPHWQEPLGGNHSTSIIYPRAGLIPPWNLWK